MKGTNTIDTIVIIDPYEVYIDGDDETITIHYTEDNSMMMSHPPPPNVRKRLTYKFKELELIKDEHEEVTTTSKWVEK